jgi:2-polyprenyl-3-methyl-5-hydroxy-6-metoxy-1,4-benzoquinol methylase
MSDAAQQSVSDFYDGRWKDFQYANRLKCQRASAILKALADTRLKQPRILDFGCGAGWLTNILSMFGPATGVELSPAAIETARQRYPHATFFAGDGQAWQSSDTFDVIVAQEVLEHFESHDEFFDTVARLLRPGGILILTTPNAETLAAMPAGARAEMSQQPVENPPTMAQLRTAAAKRFIVQRAFTIIPGHGSGGLTRRLFDNKRTWRVIDKLFGAGSGEACAAWLGLGLHLVLVAERRG